MVEESVSDAAVPLSIESHYDVPPLDDGLSTTGPPPPSTWPLYEIPPSDDLFDTNGPSTSQYYDVPPIVEESSAQYNKLAKELLSTEERYLGDLLLAKKLFYERLIGLPYRKEVETIFRYWDELIGVSKNIYLGLNKCTSPGSVFISEIDALSVYVAFCSHQQVALDTLNELVTHPDAQKLYAECSNNIEARGMNLSTFLLMPLGRVTRYPLLIEKILRESDPKVDVYQDLDTALQLLRALVSEVNRAVIEEENVFLLRWAQSHVKCPSSLKLEFTTPTRLLGPRSFLHSGVLYKQRSGRILVGILFNDFFLLTTPDEHLSKPYSFKISKTSEVHLTVYKQPMLLANVEVMSSNDDTALVVKYGMDTHSFRCVSSNARRLWASKLEQAIDMYAITVSEQQEMSKPPPQSKIIGRLLVEVLNTQNIPAKAVESPPQILRLSVGKVIETLEVDLSKSTDLHLTTQFPFETTSTSFCLTLLQKNPYCPDALLFEETSVSLSELYRESAMHRGPIIKPMLLRKDVRDRSRTSEAIVVKFVVQLFDADM